MIDNETLVKRIQQGENVNDNMMQLYNQNTGLLYKLLKRYNGYGNIIDKDDLMQEAYIYLYEAVSRYKVDKGVRFTTYLTNSIKWNIGHDMRNKRVVKLPEKLSYDISKYMGFLEEYTKEHDKQPTDKEAMERLGISESRLKTVKNAVNMVSMASIDKSISEDTTIEHFMVIFGIPLHKSNIPFRPIKWRKNKQLLRYFVSSIFHKEMLWGNGILLLPLFADKYGEHIILPQSDQARLKTSADFDKLHSLLKNYNG